MLTQSAPSQPDGDQRGVAVIAPSPLLSITAEADGDIHLHPGGQGIWVARMIARMRVPVVLCSAFGGETGTVIRALAEAEGVRLEPVTATESNGAYIEFSGDGERPSPVRMPGSPLRRHTVDDLYGASLARGLAARITVLTGTDPDGLVPASFYRRLARDLRNNGRTVLADLTGEALDAAIEGGLAIVKASHEDLAKEHRAGSGRDELASWMRGARAAGAGGVIVTRASEPALALLDGSLIEAQFPVTWASDARGAGDSLTAAFAAALARGDDPRDALRLGIAAGLLNTTRRGLGTGRADDIAAVARRVRLVESAEVDPVSAGPPSAGPPPAAEPVAADRVVEATQQGVRRADEEDAGAAG